MITKFRVLKEQLKLKHPLLRKYIYSTSKFKKKIHKPIFKEKKVLFIHIPKAAGRSVTKEIYGELDLGHYFISDYYNINKELTGSLFKIAFVRHPVYRLLSAYKYLISGGSNSADAYIGNILVNETKDFDDFVLNWLDDNKIYSWFHFIPQFEFMLYENKIDMNFIGKFENLDDDFLKLSEMIGMATTKKLRHVNKNKLTKEFDISLAVRDKVFTLYKKDYLEFDYER
jgi:hypothetical protein